MILLWGRKALLLTFKVCQNNCRQPSDLSSGGIISHDVIIENYVYISSGVTICGMIHLKEGCDIGAGATILPRVSIGLRPRNRHKV